MFFLKKHTLIEEHIINGFEIATQVENSLVLCVSLLKQKFNISPNIAIIMIGHYQPSEIYVKKKIEMANKLGIETVLKRFEENITENELLKEIDLINNNNYIDGLIVQMPLPEHINISNVLLKISPTKDLDGLNPFNAGLLHSSKAVPYEIEDILSNGMNNIEINFDLAKTLGNKTPFIPCTPIGCLHLIKTIYKKINQEIVGKNAVIIGNSNLVSKPMARLLLQCGATTTTLHSKSKNVDYFLKNADIIVSATGKKQILKKIKKNAILIDVGIRKRDENEITKLCKSKIIGDLDFERIVKCNYITPVPKGVGPMTVICLMLNSYLSALANKNIKL